MPTVSELISQHYQVRREVTQTSDLGNLLLGKLKFNWDTRRASAVRDLEKKLDSGVLANVSGQKTTDFVQWLNQNYLIITRTTKGITYYPIHPALSLSTNGEAYHVEGFINLLAETFTWQERCELVNQLWNDQDHLPPFEQMIYQMIDWQVADSALAQEADPIKFAGAPISGKTISSKAQELLCRTKEDLLALVNEVSGIQSYIVHSSRLLAFSLARYFLLQAEVDLEVPIYAAPAADTHSGVRALAHEALELHRARFARTLEQQFRAFTTKAMAPYPTPSDVQSARNLVSNIFHPNATIVSHDPSQYLRDLEVFNDFVGLAFNYYWSRKGASSRFLRQLHTAQLNMAKKAGLANSRSRNSQWSFYWLAPTLIETLLLVSQARIKQDRILVRDLLDDWWQRYRIAVLIDDHWMDEYRKYFRSLGSPDTLNEVNQRRFVEILAERGRLHKNSDDFPWVNLRY